MADELRELVKERRQTLGLSYQGLANAATVAAPAAAVSTGWLHRLETGEPVIAPSGPTLAALAAGLRLDAVRLREAAAAQFFGVRLPWAASGEAAEVAELVESLPERQRRALIDLIRIMAKDV
ncbi:helix-turn-helix domain-containing protein [Streptomyces ziwulingensis]|uniref:Transcriptional regulator n=1 Tax=Streptomyces ziwulingensis TaxID=1045501 RepID=A0ABP9BW04_9ACTN